MQIKYQKFILPCLALVLVSKVQAGPLHAAAQSGDIESIKILLQQGVEINELGHSWYDYGSALHLAVSENHLAVVKYLIEQGAIVDVRNQNDLTPLHNAAWNGNLEMMRVLLNAGADIDASNYENHTPLTCARDNNQSEAIEFIESRLRQILN